VTDSGRVDVGAGIELAWDRAGEGSPVLLVHGIGSSRAKWEPQVAPLVDAGFQVVRLDLRGFGESTRPDAACHMEDFVRDLEGFVGALDLDRFHLVGHSLGGMIAQKFALAHPPRVRSLVFASTTSHNGRRATAFARLMVTFAENGFDHVFEDPALKAEVETILGEAFPDGVDVSLLRRGMEKPNMSRANAWRACIEFSTKDDIANVTCPVLITHGTGDFLIPWQHGRKLHETIDGSEWVPEEGAGHSLPRERSEAFNARLVRFLSRVEAEPG
jgi:3-oxoadipate enol-lactonase